MSSSEAISTLAILSFLYLVLVFFCFWLFRSVELKLIGLGILTAVLSVWCAVVTGWSGASVQIASGQAGVLGRVAAGGEAAGILGRIAVLLILGGLVVIFLRWCYPASTAQKGGPSGANPV